MARCTRRWTLLLLMVTLLIVVTACSRPGSEFVGNWVNTRDAKETMQIARNGDGYLIIQGKNKIGAVYKDGGLEIGAALGQVRLTYVKSSDTVLAPGSLAKASSSASHDVFQVSIFKRAKS